MNSGGVRNPSSDSVSGVLVSSAEAASGWELGSEAPLLTREKFWTAASPALVTTTVRATLSSWPSADTARV